MGTIAVLAAGVAHEINNPLAVVVANLDYLAEELAVPGDLTARLPDLRESIAEARAGADRVRKVMRDLKTFSRVDREAKDRIDVHRVIDVAVNLAGRGTIVKAYGDVPAVLAEEGRLGLVFVHVLAAATMGDGEVRIVTRLEAMRVLVEFQTTISTARYELPVAP